MLDLEARVQLEKGETVVVEHELGGAGILVADRARERDRAASPIAARSSGSRAGEGLSSRIFWWRRWIEHSRSPR